MTKLQELNKEMSAAHVFESSELEEVFHKYIKDDYTNFRDEPPTAFDFLNNDKNKKERKIMTRKIAEISVCCLDNFFSIADSFKKLRTSLKKKGYTDLRVEFETCWDESFLSVFVDREEIDEEYNVRMEKSKVARANAKAKKDKELEELRRLAAKKGYHLQKRDK